MSKDTTWVAIDDSKRKLVVGILKPGGTEPELREITNEPKAVRRLFERLQREGPVEGVVCGRLDDRLAARAARSNRRSRQQPLLQEITL